MTNPFDWASFSAQALEFATTAKIDKYDASVITRLVEKGNRNPRIYWRHCTWAIITILMDCPEHIQTSFKIQLSEFFITCKRCSKTFQDIQDLDLDSYCRVCNSEYDWLCDDCMDECSVCGMQMCLECIEKNHGTNCKYARLWSVDDVPYRGGVQPLGISDKKAFKEAAKKKKQSE